MKDLQRLADRYGTPLYVYDGSVLVRQYEKLRAALPQRVEIFFAMKSNPNLAIVALFRRLGAGVDIASVGELRAALRVGVAPQKIVFSGPGKTDAELEAAVAADIFAINVESEGELERVQRIAQRVGRRVRVGLRLNPPFAPGEGAVIIGGAVPQKFGIDLARARAAVALAQRLSHVELIGIHIFNASNVLDAEAWVKNAESIIETAVELARATGFALRYIDVGGGLGVPYREGERELDVSVLGEGLGRAVRELSAETRVLIEPGRYLTAEAGVYVTRVVEIKETRGERFVVVDGGVHHLLRPVLVGQSHPVRVLSCGGEGGVGVAGRCSIAGPLCTALDYLARGVELPVVRVGDLVVVERVGAYGFTESMPYFLSHPTPAEVLIWEGREHVIRRRQRPEELWAWQSVPEGLL
ncbi:MAG: diaminopimelate decarboxylase [Candidatus Bipolaricaulota bacterium]|nr:diaminopimelate decarboxylase [Candidatus Bipolaricaulota bacterium]